MTTISKTTEQKPQADIINGGIVPMDKLIKESESPIKIYSEGDALEAKIKKVMKNKILVTIDDRINGIIGGKELLFDPQFVKGLKEGDTVTAYVVFLEDDKNNMLLSLRKAGRDNVWTSLAKKSEDKETISVVVTEANKGGLIIEMGGVKGFLPVSQLSAEHYPRVEGGGKEEILTRLNELVGKTVDVKVLSIDRASNKLIFSEREAIGNRDVPKDIKVGDVVKGKITGIVDFGFFVEAGGVEGLVHISEISWGKVDDIKDFVKIGDELKLKIIDIENSRLSLSLKRLEGDPWKNLVKNLKVGDKVRGKVSRITPFGAFVKIKLDKEELDALVHISEISSRHLADPKEVLKVDDEKEFKILSIEPEQHRLSLSLKALEEKTDRKEVADSLGEEKKKKAGKTELAKEKKNDELASLGASTVKKLAKAGIKEVSGLQGKTKEDLLAIEGIGDKTADKILELIN